MSFLRHWEIYQVYTGLSVERARPDSRALAHRLDESPVGYSWRVALQQSPLPLHQPKLILRQPTENFQSPIRKDALICGLTPGAHPKRLPRRSVLISSPPRAEQ